MSAGDRDPLLGGPPGRRRVLDVERCVVHGPIVCVVSKHVSQFLSLSVCLKSKYNICEMKWTYPSLLLYWVWQVAHIIWWNQPLLFIPCRDPFLKGSGFVCNATVSRIRQFDSIRVLQSCEMVSTCTELTYVLGLAGGGYVESVVWWNDPLLYISCQDSFPILLEFCLFG